MTDRQAHQLLANRRGSSQVVLREGDASPRLGNKLRRGTHLGVTLRYPRQTAHGNTLPRLLLSLLTA